MLRRMVDDFGTPINQSAKLLLIIPPELEGTANDILKAEYLSSGADQHRLQHGRCTVCPWLGSTTHWYLFDTSGIILPFIVQEREFIRSKCLRIIAKVPGGEKYGTTVHTGAVTSVTAFTRKPSLKFLVT